MLRLSKVCLRCIPIGLALVSLLVVRPIRADDVDEFYKVTAYVDPADVGNQIFVGSLGQDFHVNRPINVTDLGVFDSGQNGIAGTLVVAIFSSNGSQVTPALTFSGTAGTLIDGDRFLPLPALVTLGPGDYSLTTAGWGQDLNGNRMCDGNPACGAPPAGGPFTPPTLNTYSDGVTFTGIGFEVDGGLQYLPPVSPFPADTLNAGSFLFPEPSTAILLALGLLLLVLASRLQRKRTQ